MHFLNNLRLITKLALPVTFMLLVTIGLIVLAKSSLDTLDDTTRQIIDVHAARRAIALSVKASVNEATIQEKNLIIETHAEERGRYERRFQEAKTETLSGLDHMISLSDTPARKATNEALKRTVLEFFATQ